MAWNVHFKYSIKTHLFRYKIDFELFGYDAEDYIKMGKPGLDDLSDEKVDKNEEKNEVVDFIKENADEVNEKLE